MSTTDALKQIQECKAQFVDFRFTDTLGKEHHLTFPAKTIDATVFQNGKMFDGSSIVGWRGINQSDMILIPDATSTVVDPFAETCTVNIRCDVVEPATGRSYPRDPRSIAKRAEAYLQSTSIGDTAYFGPEGEFFLFDSVCWGNEMGHAFYEIDSTEAAWNSGTDYDGCNMGHRPPIKGGYLPVPPTDSHADIRAKMCLAMQEMGLAVEVHHHEVGTAGQCEIGMTYDTLVRKADEVQIYKYVIRNVAAAHGLTATFMPKPLVGDNGSGLHVHQSLAQDGANIFAGNGYGGLSDIALYYIGGIFRHARALNAFTNASTNSYKRLVPGFEAPVLLAYSAQNRSAACRIPYVADSSGRRIEIRFPDATANPYLAFSAMLLAGLDGIRNKIHPGEATDCDLYELSPAAQANIPTVAHSLEQALESLHADRDFLLAGDVFSNDAIDAYIQLKMADVNRLRMATHPVEFDLYYSL